MTKKIPAFALWFLLALVTVAIPLACSSSSSDNTDAASDKTADALTTGG
jgi:hypothetical protein